MASLQIDTSLEPHFSISKTKANSKKWSKDEDLRLVKMVEEHGSKDWIIVATFIPDRSDITIISSQISKKGSTKFVHIFR